jgi:hypothetical protein
MIEVFRNESQFFVGILTLTIDFKKMDFRFLAVIFLNTENILYSSLLFLRVIEKNTREEKWNRLLKNSSDTLALINNRLLFRNY